jgi:periplasmic protein TonB
VRAGAASGSPWPLVATTLASCLLHGGAVLALVALHRAAPLPDAAQEQGAEIVWQDRPEDSAAGTQAGAPSQASADVASAEAPPMDTPPVEPEREVVEAPPLPPPEAPLSDPTRAEAPPRENEVPPPPDETAPPSDLPLPPPVTPAPPRAVAARPPAPPSQVAAVAAAPRPAAPGPAAQPEPQGGSIAVGAAVSPPGLIDGVRNAEPEYPLANRQRGDQGVVTVVLSISEAGEVMGVEVVSTSGHPSLDDSARRAVQRWRFRPATRNGIPVPGSIRTAIHFRLR